MHDTIGLPNLKGLHDMVTRKLEQISKDAEVEIEKLRVAEMKAAQEAQAQVTRLAREQEDAARYPERVRPGAQQSPETSSDYRGREGGPRRDELQPASRPE